MRAVVVEEPGGPDALVIRERPDPVPGEGETLIETRASGVNFADAMIRRGAYPQMPPLPFVPGSEVAGETADGRRVLGLVRENGGGYAERVAVPDAWLYDLPEGASFEEGAAFPLAFLTAWLPLTHQAAVGPGKRVLVTAAAGGVGSAAVQVSIALGATVVAACGSEAKLALPRSLGAVEAVTYDALGGVEPVDVVLDPVGGSVFTDAIRLLRPLGTLVAVGVAGGPWPALDPALIVGRNVSVAGFYLGRLLQRRTDLVARAMGDLLRLWAHGAIRPVVGATYPLERAADAHRALEDRSSTGKLVLVP